MPTQLQLRGGTTAQHSSFTGLVREVTVDTTKDTLIVHDGSTVGGHELARADLSNVTVPLDTTYSISAETATGGVNLRLTGSDATTDDVKFAAGSNITLTRTDANTITIASTGGGASNLDSLTDVAITAPTNGQVLKYNGTSWVNGTDDVGGGGGGSGTVNSGAANKLAYYPAAGTTVDDIASIEWNSGTSTLSVTGTISATDFVSTGVGVPNFSSDTDLEIITDASGITPKTFTFKLDGTLEIAEDTAINMQGAGTNAIQALGALDVGAGGILNLISLTDVTLSPGGQIVADGDIKVNAGYQVKFDTTPFRVVGTAPTTSVGATGDKAGDVAMNGTSIFYCTANYDGTTNIWVKSAWTTTGAW